MPEGDTIFRAARRLNAALAGGTVVRFLSVFPQLTRVDHQTPIAGRTIEQVTSAGKHLLMHFSGDLILRTHMRMNGSWHLYRPGERWRRGNTERPLEVETADWLAVGFAIPVAEFVSGSALDQTEVGRLGPDLLGAEFDEQEALRRLRADPGREIAEAILDQRIVGGIGNVYKSEVLFIRGIQPFKPVGDVEDAELLRLLELSRKLLKLNVPADGEVNFQGSGRWTTGRLNPRERLWVYGRGGRPCRKCGSAIRSARQGLHARLTFWCERCQR